MNRILIGLVSLLVPALGFSQSSPILPPDTIYANPTSQYAPGIPITLGTNLSFAGTVLNATGGGGASTFDQLGTGTNVMATMLCGTGCQLGPTGSGTVTATSLNALTGLPQIPTGNILGYYGTGTGSPAAIASVQIPSGNSGGLLGFTSSTTLASSAQFEAAALMVGGGAGVLPYSLQGTGVLTATSDVASYVSFLPASLGGCGVNVNPAGITSNTVCGTSNGVNITSGINDSAFGNANLAHVTTGNSNSAFGANSLVWTSTGGQNTGVGASAGTGSGSAPGTGNNNTFVGAFSGTLCQGTCGNFTAIGESAGSNGTTATNDLALGYNCQLTSATASGEVDICAGIGGTVLRITGGGSPASSITTTLGSFQQGGTTFTLGTGTGACATTTTLVGISQAGSFICTGTTGASSAIINLPTAAHGWYCGATDVTNNIVFAESAVSTNSCRVNATITSGDQVVFAATSY